MRIEITGKKYQVSDHLESVINSKLAKLDRYFNDDIIAKVVCREEHGKAKMELTIPFGNNIIRCEEVGETMYHIIDTIVPKVERQIRKHRTKLEKRIREGAFDIVERDARDEEPAPTVVRKKRFELLPMTEEEAVLQLELVDNDFFVFLNAEDNLVNVAYKRKDGNVGIIEVTY